MTDKPDFIDNINGNTMAAALRRVLGGVGEADEMAEDTPPVDEARIATAYFSPAGFARIAPALGGIPSVRLLLGTDPIATSEIWHKKLDETTEHFVRRKVQQNLKEQEVSLRTERNHIDFERTSTGAIRHLVAALRGGNMEVRRYEDSFLHAKAYIFTPAVIGAFGKLEAVIAGSSNLTASGLSENLELNLGRYDTPTVERAKAWFDQLWDEATPFDLAAYFDDIFALQKPFNIFLRVLWELYGAEIHDDKKSDKDLPLTSFQKHGVVRAMRLIDETGGAIVADEVGLGKTFIAGDIIARYREQRQRTLLICPAALRDSSWKQFSSDYEFYLEMVSFEELANDRQLFDPDRRPNSNSTNLKRPLDEYQLIIIDEAHNYRNPDAPYRAAALRELLYGQRKDVLMLTATPVNNSLWDLYHLMRFFIKQDSFLANKGIISIKGRFDAAMKTDPNSLSPDVLYPIIDATTVKRTRQFIKKHYPNDQVNIDGVMRTIVFPDPVAISVRYDIDVLMPGLFDLIEMYFDPDDPDCILLARYKADTYKLNPIADNDHDANTITGLLLSGLLKRFESSTGAFRISIERLISQHERFLQALEKGHVVKTQFLQESAHMDDAEFDEFLDASEEVDDASLYDQKRLKKDVEDDLSKLENIYGLLENVVPEKDPKLLVLVEEIEAILKQAQDEKISNADETDKRKIIIFSFFADTVRWINAYLNDQIATNPALAPYQGRLGVVVGSGQGEDHSKAKAAARFAPKTAGMPRYGDEIDILISTDVLAEGVNLQQARHIINYDMPWNPMRLVQRHGRIDRIGSLHRRVFMRTIFPVDRLDTLLGLEERIAHKIALAAASVGIASPISSLPSASRYFAETKKEIQKLLAGDASLYERGGTASATQTGEEYRHTLRKAMAGNFDHIEHMAWKAGSVMCKGDDQGIFFCAKVGTRTYLRFVHAEDDWGVKYRQTGEDGTSLPEALPIIDHEIGRCLRLVECSEDQELIEDEVAQEAAYDLWLIARRNIHEDWTFETDPAHLQPRIRLLNRQVADFIRDNRPADYEEHQIEKALDIVETPWPRRDENTLREWFNEGYEGRAKSTYLIKKILASGLEPCQPPEALPLIEESDIKLIVWMAIKPDLGA